jgi:hypothetical protein
LIIGNCFSLRFLTSCIEKARHASVRAFRFLSKPVAPSKNISNYAVPLDARQAQGVVRAEAGGRRLVKAKLFFTNLQSPASSLCLFRLWESTISNVGHTLAARGGACHFEAGINGPLFALLSVRASASGCVIICSCGNTRLRVLKLNPWRDPPLASRCFEKG